MVTLSSVQPPRDKWEVEIVAQEPPDAKGIVTFEYVVREKGGEPFLLNNHKAQIRTDHQRIKRDGDGKLLHVSGAAVDDVEDFLANDSRAYRWADKDGLGNWRDDKGRVLAPYMFAAAKWAGGKLEELDPQWQREQFVLPLQGQIDALIQRYLNRAEAKGWTGDRRGTTFFGQVGASADDSIIRAPIGTNLRTGASALDPIDQTFISFGTESAATLHRGAFGRITGVTIPKDATINTATVSVWGQFGETTSIESVIEAIDADDPAAPTTFGEWNAQAFTTASVTWDFSTTFTNNLEIVTPSVVPVIEEITTRPGWASGQAMILVILDDLDTDTDRRRSPYSYDGNSSQGLALDTDYTVAETRSLAGDQPTATGILARIEQALRALVGSQPTATGVLVRVEQALRALAGDQPTATGILTRVYGRPRSVVGDQPASTGVVARVGQAIRILTGSQPSGAGTLATVKQALRALAGVQPSATGTLTRTEQALRGLTGNQPTATGELSASLVTTRSLTGAQPAATGVLTRIENALRLLSGDQPTATGTLLRIEQALRSLVGDQPAASGTLAATLAAISRDLVGDQPASTGALARVEGAVRSLAGDQPASAGTLARVEIAFRTMSGSQPAGTGTLSASIVMEMTAISLEGSYTLMIALQGSETPIVTLEAQI